MREMAKCAFLRLCGLCCAIFSAFVVRNVVCIEYHPSVFNPSKFDVLYNGTVSKNNAGIYKFIWNDTQPQTSALRITTWSHDASRLYPVLFVIRKQDSVLSWQVPILLNHEYDYYTVSRTLCPGSSLVTGPPEQIYIDVMSMSTNDTSYQFEATVIRDFEIEMNTTKNVLVTPSQPVYYRFTFPPNTDIVLVKLRSDSELCTTVSIQDIHCPVYDLDIDVDFLGQHQTMTKQATFTVMRKNFKSDSIYIVLVVKPSNRDCSLIDVITTREKSINVTIVTATSRSQYAIACVVAVSVFLGIYLLAFISACTYQIRNKNWGMPPAPGIASGTENGEGQAIGAESVQDYGSVATASNVPIPAKPMKAVVDNSPEGTTSADPDINPDHIDFLEDAETDKAVVRSKVFLFVSDLSRKSTKQLQKRYSLYSWNLVTVAIFYGLPVIQLVITYQTIQNMTGNEDTCYYNFNCAQPLGVLSAFNSVFSNIGYIMLGILFLILVRRRDVLHQRAVKQNDRLEKYHGIPEHYGLFYAMGIALMMEGVMSGCYHVCPNHSNFQFDTSFMYITACLLILKIFQNRHPDINARAHVSYLLMALLIFLTVIGVLYGTEAFWIVFTVFHVTSMFILSGKLYYVGEWKINWAIFSRAWRTVRTHFFTKPLHIKRFVLLLCVNAVNWGIALYGVIVRPANFATFLLAILIFNLMLYVSFYIIMKLINKEKILPLPLFYILTSALLWASALYFFFNHVNSWQDKPAVSREKNRDCILLGFFDHHDVWHFLSAMSLFTSFMILMSLDDDLWFTLRDKIPVF